MNEKTLVVVKGEAACKLLDYFLAYKKLRGEVELRMQLDQDDGVVIGALPVLEEQAVDSKTN